MNVIELHENTFSYAVSEAERVLRSGGIVISPTDTVYGILGDAASESAVSKMFSLKNRPSQKNSSQKSRKFQQIRRKKNIRK